jgi:hypothetical protein
LDGDTAGKDGGGSSVIADGYVLVVGQERIVGAEEPAYAGSVMDGGIEIGVVGDVDGFEKGGSGDRVKRGFDDVTAAGFGTRVKEGCEGFAEKCPRAGAEGHEGIEDGRLTGGGEAGRKESGFGAGVEVEEMSPDGGTEAWLAVEYEGAVREVG